MKILTRGRPAGVVIGLLSLAACDGDNIFGLGRESEIDRAGAIAGSVLADGSPLGGVRVIVVNRDSVETDSQGEYRFGSVPAGSYSVTVRVPIGFVLAAGEAGTRTATVAEGGTASVNWRLQSSASGFERQPVRDGRPAARRPSGDRSVGRRHASYDRSYRALAATVR